jgi:ribosomal protein S18 acetylase RimI-like enzyme
LGNFVRIRPAHIEDAEAIANLHANSWRVAYRGILSDEFLDNEVATDRLKTWQDKFNCAKNNQKIWVAEDSDDLAGFICIYGDEHETLGTFIDNLHVAAAHQGQGIGRQLMHTVAEWVNHHCASKGLYLEVLADNQQAQRFYQGLAGKPVKSQWWQPPGDGEKVKEWLYAWQHADLVMQAIR